MYQLGQFRGIAIGMHQRGMGLEPHRQRCHTGEHPVLVGWQIEQHHGQRGLVKIFGVVARHPDTDGARPVGDAGQFGTQVVQDVLRRFRVMVGDIEQRQGRCAGVAV